MDERASSFLRLLKIMDELREKCPWDKKQTIESIRHLTIEETYELSDAILKNDLNEIKNSVIFYCILFFIQELPVKPAILPLRKL